jgi:hypothetical protein
LIQQAGLLTRDMENAYLAFDPTEEAPINGLFGYSITYRVATGPSNRPTNSGLPAEV